MSLNKCINSVGSLERIKVWNCEGTADAEGIDLKVARVLRITQPQRQTQAPDVDYEENGSAEDSLEGLDVFTKDDSDVASGQISVDTDVDSIPSHPEILSSDSPVEHGSSCDSGAEPTDKGPMRIRSTLKPSWFTHYFYIRENVPHVHKDVKILIYDAWATPAAMGCKERSKTFTPEHHGETIGNPIRSLLLCRAWMVWRCRQFEAAPWAFASRGRARQFEADATCLEDDIRKLQSPDSLLGNVIANDKLQMYVPDISERLKAL